MIATLYTSGKLVVQGSHAREFTLRFLEEDVSGSGSSAETSGTPASGEAPDRGLGLDRPLIGSDEAGKGDYFGPLVVCALQLEPGDGEALRRGGIMDSKRLADDSARRIAAGLRERFEPAVEVLAPPEYNVRHAEVGNLNELLADMHAAAIRRLNPRDSDVLVDRFANAGLLEKRLAGSCHELRQVPRAEGAMAVAAASIVARAVFLEELDQLSADYAVDLHKGAGEPTDKAARQFVEFHGRPALDKVAKLHFKNTAKLER